MRTENLWIGPQDNAAPLNQMYLDECPPGSLLIVRKTGMFYIKMNSTSMWMSANGKLRSSYGLARNATLERMHLVYRREVEPR